MKLKECAILFVCLAIVLSPMAGVLIALGLSLVVAIGFLFAFRKNE